MDDTKVEEVKKDAVTPVAVEEKAVTSEDAVAEAAKKAKAEEEAKKF